MISLLFQSNYFNSIHIDKMKASLLAISCYVAAVAAHGRIISPQPRGVGPAMAAACGQEAINKVNRDDTIPLENIKPATAACSFPH